MAIPTEQGDGMGRIKKIVTVTVIAVIVTGTAAFGFPSRYMTSTHKSFTWDGFDYRHVESYQNTVSGCVGHHDLYERRRVMRPWEDWKGYSQDHCTQV